MCADDWTANYVIGDFAITGVVANHHGRYVDESF
jgi:hypothetical protein